MTLEKIVLVSPEHIEQIRKGVFPVLGRGIPVIPELSMLDGEFQFLDLETPDGSSIIYCLHPEENELGPSVFSVLKNEETETILIVDGHPKKMVKEQFQDAILRCLDFLNFRVNAHIMHLVANPLSEDMFLLRFSNEMKKDSPIVTNIVPRSRLILSSLISPEEKTEFEKSVELLSDEPLVSFFDEENEVNSILVLGQSEYNINIVYSDPERVVFTVEIPSERFEDNMQDILSDVFNYSDVSKNRANHSVVGEVLDEKFMKFTIRDSTKTFEELFEDDDE